MMILSRKDLREALLGALGGVVLIGLAFWFRNEIELYIGKTATSWLLNIALFLFLLSLPRVLIGWLNIRNWERTERKLKEEDARERAQWASEERQEQAAYDAFLIWVRQNPRTADRLMSVVEHEQIEDPEYQNWLIERREREGPNQLTDLPRLFDWLKARQDLKKFGIDPPDDGGVEFDPAPAASRTSIVVRAPVAKA
jgi:hypothetical protein